MGITYKALDPALQFPVALKVINFDAAELEANRERFLREARAAAKLRHPHVASVLYYGVRLGECFYAMELVEGETLAERVQRTGPLPVLDALRVIAQVASALEAAEEHGLVHRDLKPANLMLVNGPDINVKIIDFGLAKVVGAEEPADWIPHDGFIGTPAFASPEQFRGAEIDRRSDYFSLGSTFFYLLTGNPPFEAEQACELAEQMIHRGSVIARLKAARIPLPVRNLADLLLSASPERRPQNGQATIQKINYELADRDFAKAEQILAADPKQEFEFGEHSLICRDFLLGWIRKGKGDDQSGRVAFANSRPTQVAYAQKQPNEPNPWMMLALTDAALGRKDDALNEGRRAMMMRAISQDAIDGPPFAVDSAEVYHKPAANSVSPR